PDKWMSDVFIFLSLCMASEPVDPAIFAVQARRHWDWRLRQRVEGKNFADLADVRDRTIELQNNQRKERARDIRRRSEALSAHLAAHTVEAFVPANWPTRDGVTPIAKPHEARNEIVIGKDGKKVALFTETAVQSETWRHRGWWNFSEWPAQHLDLTPTAKL